MEEMQLLFIFCDNHKETLIQFDPQLVEALCYNPEGRGFDF
jgi:hypothetical protein